LIPTQILIEYQEDWHGVGGGGVELEIQNDQLVINVVLPSRIFYDGPYHHKDSQY